VPGHPKGGPPRATTPGGAAPRSPGPCRSLASRFLQCRARAPQFRGRCGSAPPPCRRSRRRSASIGDRGCQRLAWRYRGRRARHLSPDTCIPSDDLMVRNEPPPPSSLTRSPDRLWLTELSALNPPAHRADRAIVVKRERIRGPPVRMGWPEGPDWCPVKLRKEFGQYAARHQIRGL
jgi:hypothetical protein